MIDILMFVGAVLVVAGLLGVFMTICDANTPDDDDPYGGW